MHYRASDILSWKVGDVRGLEAGDTIDCKEKKTSKYRKVTLNTSSIAAVKALLTTRPNAHDDELMFAGPDPMKAITVGWFGRIVKRWCHDAQLRHGK